MGIERVTGAASSTNGPFVSIQALAATVIASLTGGQDATGTFTAIPVPAGTTVYIKCTGFTLTSGDVLAYKGDLMA